MVLVMALLINYCAFALVVGKGERGGLFGIETVVSVGLAVWVVVAYLVVALSDPGVYSEGKIHLSENSHLRYCQHCDMKVP